MMMHVFQSVVPQLEGSRHAFKDMAAFMKNVWGGEEEVRWDARSVHPRTGIERVMEEKELKVAGWEKEDVRKAVERCLVEYRKVVEEVERKGKREAKI